MGYHTVESIAYAPMRELENVKGISEQKMVKIQVSLQHLWLNYRIAHPLDYRIPHSLDY
jgi:ERCC4-type nuclease